MLFGYYKLLRDVVRSGAGDVYLYGGEELGLWCMVTLLRNMPARRESAESCPSQVFRELESVSSSRWKMFWRKALMWNCMAWISAVLGLVSSFVFSFVLRRCDFGKCYRMLLFRPDLIVFAAQNYWGRKFGDFFGGDKQFSAVDVRRVYSLVIRSAYHIVDINNRPSQGDLEDKKLFHERGVEHGLPCVSVIPFEDLADPTRAEGLRFPLFAKPRKLQWGQGVMKLTSRDQKEFRDVARPGSEFQESFVVQRKMENIPELLDYFPPDAPLCTARITTFLQRSEGPGGARAVKVLESWIRVGASGALADQIENGGSTFAVHAETGVVWNGTTTERMVKGDPFLEPGLNGAPGAKKSITGHKLPFWSQALDTVKEAHVKLAPDAFTVGWDIVFTPGGIEIMEGNLMSMVALHIGMRYGTMSLLWPDSPLVWLALSDWLKDKEGGLKYTAETKRSKLQRVKSSLQGHIARLGKEKEPLKNAILKLKAADLEDNAPLDELKLLQNQLMLKEGEIHGLSTELAAVKDAILRI
ncbi:hypothetical protein A3770_02p12860 [Chloropicon primus]|uniref:Uncharacterized protein n=2 Tax=Chloropicon primus TaxID=1764295 RepID=A0A5B8MDT5_9CHLO|nr:hypothetical protein A3770_02p12860 [Chloropicon primus]|eukprot:QDZ18768.1 hypothetical protein A3770_02p12860 [Chloropicon primus]